MLFNNGGSKMTLKFHPAFNHDGTPAPNLITVVLQDFESNKVLYPPTMDEKAWCQTQATGRVHVYSRTDKVTKCKGVTSGDCLEVVSVFVNCNWDCLLIKVRRLGKDGGVCHTVDPDGKNRPSCFFHQLA